MVALLAWPLVQRYREVPPPPPPVVRVPFTAPAGAELGAGDDPLEADISRERFIRQRSWDVYPYSERNDEFRHRTVNVIEGIISLHPGQRVVVACHGGVINAYVGEVLGLQTGMFFRPAHASVHRLRAHDLTRALWSLNETHHLVGEGIDLVSF